MTETINGGNVLTAGETYTISNEDVLLNAATMAVFTVAGGAIEILSYFGQCTTILGSPSTTKVGIDATDGTAYDGDFSTGVDCDGVIEGGTIRFLHTDSESAMDITSKENAGSPLSWFCPAGSIINTHTSTTGAITWYMTFRPLDAGVTVTAT